MLTLTAFIASLALIASGVSSAASSNAQPGSGLVFGQTQISYGCSGPARVGHPSCEIWHAFPDARFGIRQIGPKGQPLHRSSESSAPTARDTSPFG
jgi:hypothetical protein